MSNSKTMAEVLHLEGAWCGNCEFEGWDACKDCRDTCEGYARALSAAGFGLVSDAKAEALREAAEALEEDASRSSYTDPEEVTQGQLDAAEWLRARAVS